MKKNESYSPKADKRFFISKYLPLSPFVAINILGLIVVRKDMLSYYNTDLKRHEKIHTLQMIETFFIGFYIWYIVEWLIRVVVVLIKKERISKAYKSILFEKEAYTNQNNPEYLKSRRAFQYKWLK